MSSGIDLIVVVKDGAVVQTLSMNQHMNIRIIDLDNQKWGDQITDYANMPYVASSRKIIESNEPLIGEYKIKLEV